MNYILRSKKSHSILSSTQADNSCNNCIVHGNSFCLNNTMLCSYWAEKTESRVYLHI